MSYSVKEIFLTLQGEGALSGRSAVFCRFSGCNLWSGRESDRHRAQCQFCDTDFVGVDGVRGGRFATAQQLAQAIDQLWQGDQRYKMVVCTGGEPLLQLDLSLIDALHQLGFFVAIETNGTLPVPTLPNGQRAIDWICVSPKAGCNLVQSSGDELKVVIPQEFDWSYLQQLDFKYFFAQPMAGELAAEHLQEAIRFCLRYPQWRLSLQSHKMIGID